MKRHVSLTLPIVFFLGLGSHLRAQGTEIEPNQPCALAQDFGQVLLPFTLSGSLDPPPNEGDVDFYRFEAVPESGARIDLEGRSTGKGTLADPFVGFFDSGCNLIAVNDDSGTLNSRLLLTVPADGVIILAATSCCDHQFQGNAGVSGSYQLILSPVAFAVSISGRAVDATNGEPLPGDRFPFAFVELVRCSGGVCSEHVAARSTDSSGEFRFDAASLGTPLLAGTYRVRINANFYLTGEAGPFDVAEGEDLDLGEVSLAPIPVAGAVMGRIVDSISGVPLSGDASPFVRVDLVRCEVFGCFFYLASQQTDHQGRFRFERDFNGFPLPVGAYLVRVSAQEYEPRDTETFTVGEEEIKDVGDVPLNPFPIRFSEVSPCGDLSRDGGLCTFSVRITNQRSEPVDGAIWSVVQALGTGSFTDHTIFQTDAARRLRLPPGRSRLALFSFTIPSTVRNGAVSCVQVLVGEGRPTAFFNTLGRRDLFCIQKGIHGALSVLSEKESRRALEDTRKGIRPWDPKE